MPPWAPDLPALGEVDSGQLTPEDLSPASSVPGASIAPNASTLRMTAPTRPFRPVRRPPRGLMRAVVLVGGFGTRLRPLTASIPKPMLPIGHGR